MLLLLFMYVFMFPLNESIIFLNSNYIVGFVLIVYSLINIEYRTVILKTFKNKKVFSIFVSLFFIIIYTFIVPSFFSTYDYSLIPTLLNLMLNLLIGVFVFSLYVVKNRKEYIIQDLINIFIIQSAIQLLSFSSTAINEFLNNFRSESTIIRGQLGYGGIRGLAISGPSFFSLGIAYGLIIIYLLANWKDIFPKSIFFKFLVLILILFGAISAARVSMVGLIIGISYLFFNKIKNKKRFYNKRKIVKTIFSLFISLLLFGLMIVYIVPSITNNHLNRLFRIYKNFAFESIINFTQTGKATTRTSEVLFGSMYFPLDLSTFIFGDGYYTSINGGYYMGTDAGYMRNILFFGILGLILLFSFQILFLNWKNKDTKFLNVLILIYILLVHVKGEALGYSIILQNIMFLVLMKNIEFKIYT